MEEPKPSKKPAEKLVNYNREWSNYIDPPIFTVTKCLYYYH